jgi:hypothetical protein
VRKYSVSNKNISKQKRGEINELIKLEFINSSGSDLINLLDDSNPQIRTAAAMLLGERQSRKAIGLLCKNLVRENALYSKIAISEALGKIGISALPDLITYIGKIGKNQHKKLPAGIFKKWNYPLPRDIVIRTIVKIGKPALPELRKTVLVAAPPIASELVDAIGYISFYNSDQHALNDLVTLVDKYQQEEVLIWKLLRALQSFTSAESINILQKYFLHSQVPELRWEAARSLAQLNAEKILILGLNDPNDLVRDMVNLGLDYINDLKKRHKIIQT